MFEVIKNKIKKHPSVYVLAKAIRLFRDKEYQNLIMAYYRLDINDTALVFKNWGNENKLICLIELGITQEDRKGLCALIKHTLQELYFAQKMSLKPYIMWGKYTKYYDEALAKETQNVFEYYFEPICDESYQNIIKSQNVMYINKKNYLEFNKNYGDYHTEYTLEDKAFDILGDLYKKYFRLNSRTASYIYSHREKLLQSKKTLGIHVRGTDFKEQWKNHPHFSGFQIYIDACNKALKENKYEQIFLATDDEEALELFQNEYGDMLVYYKDTKRGTGTTAVHCHAQETDRKYYHYETGLEVLRDVYTLAGCKGIITGLSQVSFAARYVKRALGEEYEWQYVVQTEINKKGK